MVKELNIDDTIIRRGSLREKYNVKKKNLLIIFYIILFSQILLAK